MPEWVLWAGIGVIMLGLLMFTTFWLAGPENVEGGDNRGHLVLSAMIMLGGVFLILSWKNQYIVMIDQNTFRYSTIFGRKKEYRFEDICGLKQNMDSWTLLLDGPNGSGRVHIESCARFSPQFSDRLLRACKAARCVDMDLFS